MIEISVSAHAQYESGQTNISKRLSGALKLQCKAVTTFSSIFIFTGTSLGQTAENLDRHLGNSSFFQCAVLTWFKQWWIVEISLGIFEPAWGGLQDRWRADSYFFPKNVWGQRPFGERTYRTPTQLYGKLELTGVYAIVPAVGYNSEVVRLMMIELTRCLGGGRDVVETLTVDVARTAHCTLHRHRRLHHRAGCHRHVYSGRVQGTEGGSVSSTCFQPHCQWRHPQSEDDEQKVYVQKCLRRLHFLIPNDEHTLDLLHNSPIFNTI